MNVASVRQCSERADEEVGLGRGCEQSILHVQVYWSRRETLLPAPDLGDAIGD